MVREITIKEFLNMSNIWHDISPKRIHAEDFICVVEISGVLGR